MAKKYVMLVDEKGFLDYESAENFSMSGIIFEYDYCVSLKDEECELEKRLNEYKSIISKNEKCSIPIEELFDKKNSSDNKLRDGNIKLIKALPRLLKDLKFNVIVSSTKKSDSDIKTSYEIVTNNLLKKFYSFILKKEGICGGVILEGNKDFKIASIQQKFFNIYNERNCNLKTLDDIQKKINSFIICEKNNSSYANAFEITHILNNIINIIYSGMILASNSIISNIEKDEVEILFNIIRDKMLNEIAIDGLKSNEVYKTNFDIESLTKEINLLKEEIDLKNIRIRKSQREIEELTEEIKVLKQQLEEAVTRKSRDKIIFEIFSDSDVRIKEMGSKQVRLV